MVYSVYRRWLRTQSSIGSAFYAHLNRFIGSDIILSDAEWEALGNKKAERAAYLALVESVSFYTVRDEVMDYSQAFRELWKMHCRNRFRKHVIQRIR